MDSVIHSKAIGFVGTKRSSMSRVSGLRVRDWNGGVTRMVSTPSHFGKARAYSVLLHTGILVKWSRCSSVASVVAWAAPRHLRPAAFTTRTVRTARRAHIMSRLSLYGLGDFSVYFSGCSPVRGLGARSEFVPYVWVCWYTGAHENASSESSNDHSLSSASLLLLPPQLCPAMRVRTLEIRWHNGDPIYACDFQPLPQSQLKKTLAPRVVPAHKDGQPSTSTSNGSTPAVGAAAYGVGQSFRFATGGSDNNVRVSCDVRANISLSTGSCHLRVPSFSSTCLWSRC